MTPTTGQTVTRLADYRPANFLIDGVDLEFSLHPTATRVTARIRFRANPAVAPGGDLILDGREMRLLSARIDGVPVEGLEVTEAGLRLPGNRLPGDAFTWECETEVNPTANTALDGLYMSNGMYCTQCEAQGFRKITYYPDRPDVMARFRVRIEGDAPVKLSNGNPVAQGRGFAEWEDPFPKPSYLFALVAGDLVAHRDDFTTMSGRRVALEIWVRPGDQDRCAYAMDALKRSMRWDEAAYGREYDLDLFMIVAVDDFNMGAMENKGLNIFNSKYVLASPDTATDRDYELIEGIIAHEYFHNWTGNRITCRDWFQLSLKEGLTVFRDQQFSADQRSAPVKRINDVLQLRARQFREDAGPLSHPVQPSEYVEINNFYTATIYEKGAEVIRMLHLLVGPQDYRRALDLYFDRHDGQACTIGDWVRVFEDATDRDLTQFRLWYAQAGTPVVTVTPRREGGRTVLRLTQTLPAGPHAGARAPMVIPVATGFIGPDGREVLPTQVLELTQAEQEFAFEVPEGAVPSLLRGFSAPVTLRGAARENLAFLAAHDTDPFNRWEAGRQLGTEAALALAADPASAPDPRYIAALARVAADESLDPAFRALALSLPARDALAQESHARGTPVDPDAIEAAHLALSRAVAEAAEPAFRDLYAGMATPGPYSPEAGAAARRSLRATALFYLTRLDPEARDAAALFDAAGNMTESLNALSVLIQSGAPAAAAAVATFYDRWQQDRLVIDKWFLLQAMMNPAGQAVEVVAALTGHRDFDWKNPNRFRALIGGFSAHATGFHRADGAGYRLVRDWLLRLDPVNPQTTARMAGAFETWPRFEAGRQALIRAVLDDMAGVATLSPNTREMVERMRKAG